MMRGCKAILAGLIALVLLVPDYACAGQFTRPANDPNNLIYMPQPIDGRIKPEGLPEVKFGTVTTSDGLSIRHWFAPPRDADKPVGVLFYGNGAHMALRAYEARALLDAGYGVLLASYRGYEGNPGSPSEQGLYADARAQIEWLIKNNHNFFLMGHSLGSGVVVQMATEYKVEALILEAPFTSMSAAIKSLLPFIPVDALLTDKYDNLAKISQVHAPVMVIHGNADVVIPFAQGQRLFAAANEPKQAVWLRGANHNGYYAYGGLPELIAFLNKYTGLSKYTGATQ